MLVGWVWQLVEVFYEGAVACMLGLPVFAVGYAVYVAQVFQVAGGG